MWTLIPFTLVLLNGIQSFIVSSPDLYRYLDASKRDFWEADNEEARELNAPEPKSKQDKLWVLDVVPGAQELRRASDEESELFENSFGDLIEFSEQWRARGASDVPRSPDGRPAAAPRPDAPDDRTTLNLIHTTVNKFVLSSLQDRHQHLEDSFADSDNPSITLYIKSPYSAIVISYGDCQWNFFLRPPSPLPAWLYEPHPTAGDVQHTSMDVNEDRATAIAVNGSQDMTTGVSEKFSKDVMGSKVDKTAIDVKRSASIKVPSDVKSAFYRALLRYLRVALRFDLS